MLETSLIRWVGRRLEVNDLLLHHSTLTKKSDMSYNQPILAIRSMQAIFFNNWDSIAVIDRD